MEAHHISMIVGYSSLLSGYLLLRVFCSPMDAPGDGRDALVCHSCQYDLSGVRAEVCPECGTSRDASIREEAEQRRVRELRAGFRRILLIMLGGYLASAWAAPLTASALAYATQRLPLELHLVRLRIDLLDGPTRFAISLVCMPQLAFLLSLAIVWKPLHTVRLAKWTCACGFIGLQCTGLSGSMWNQGMLVGFVNGGAERFYLQGAIVGLAAYLVLEVAKWAVVKRIHA
ncbi:MAG TPA: hypothetical protein VK176_13825 [Phycisphaerales bacterium]|nr:hypothetical protein [Phycisphaerales bacterium]